MKKITLSTCCFILFGLLQAQNSKIIQSNLEWEKGYRIHRSESVFAEKSLYFQGAQYSSGYGGLPIWEARIPMDGPARISAKLISSDSEIFEPGFDDEFLKLLGNNIELTTSLEKDRDKYYAFVSLIPLTKNSQYFERLTSFSIEVQWLPTMISQPRSGQPTISELSEGDIFKIAVDKSGVHKLTADYFSNALGLDLNNLDSRKIKILCTEGGPLRQTVGEPRQEDLLDYPIFFEGGNDGSFDPDDFILFYAQGPHRNEYSSSKNLLERKTNPYSFKQHFFIKIGADDGARMSTTQDLGSGEFQVDVFNDVQRFEEDKFNILFQEDQAQGSGQQFYGDLFNQIRRQDFTFDFPNITSNSDVTVVSKMAVRSPANSRFNMSINGLEFQSANISGVAIGNADSNFARTSSIIGTTQSSDPLVQVNIEYPAVGDGTNKAWLDYIEVNTQRDLILSGKEMQFQNFNSQNFSSSTFSLQTAIAETKIWDLTNWNDPREQIHSKTGNNLIWSSETNGVLKKYLALDVNGDFPSPEFVAKISNQNLHGIQQTDLVILYHENFKSEAERLADHRRNKDGYRIKLVNIDHLWNEFSGGSIDPVAIRDLMKMIYERDPNFKYLLLFGDGTFDFRDVYGAGKNFIPTFETKESGHPIYSYPTDDYFSLLDDGEGTSNTDGLLDIAVGRIPCKTLTEAANVVDKIIHYDASEKTLGDWRNRLVFVGDDEDTNLHFNSSERVADKAANLYPQANQVKIYLDAFQQESTSGGARFPLATEAFTRNIFRGALVVNYFGHGGSQGWAQERVITQQDIQSWRNYDNLPVFVTATCSFTGFDEPGLTTGGELALLNPNGGAVALFSTVRAVFAQQNESMVQSLFDTILVNNIPLGEILRVAKNKTNASTENLRKFSVFGDPSMFLKVPPLGIRTRKINNKIVPLQSDSIAIDTLSALQTVTIEGEILGLDGNILESFNGRVYPTIYDKIRKATTLGQDVGSIIKEFEIRNSIVFKGRASVVNGKFQFSFIVPKDIDYEIGGGRISYYAEDGTQLDAKGYFEDFAVGGGANADLNDDQAPIVEVHMNDIPFPDGGITNENPTLIAKLSDDYGINIAGQAVGHNLTAVLDGNTTNSFILNDFYESALDDYTKGEVRFPLFNIAPGKHEIEVKAWDISNNSGVGSIEFFVAESGKIALDHVLNYPNPFTTSTNFQFEHNLNGYELDVQVQIFTVSGKLVKTIQERVLPVGSLVRDIQWDGKDDYGDQLARGIYVYRVKVRNIENVENQSTIISDYEKLVILK